MADFYVLSSETDIYEDVHNSYLSLMEELKEEIWRISSLKYSIGASLKTEAGHMERYFCDMSNAKHFRK